MNEKSKGDAGVEAEIDIVEPKVQASPLNRGYQRHLPGLRTLNIKAKKCGHYFC